MIERFEGIVLVERILSQLDAGCIFAGRADDGRSIRVKFAGHEVQPLPGDSFEVRGLLSSYRDRFGNVVAQVSSKHMTRVIGQGDLLGPWLERLPNIGETRSKRLLDAFGHSLAEVLGDATRLREVAIVIEPDKPALAARIAAQVYAAVAEKDGATSGRAAEVAFLTFLERLGMREVRLARQVWRFMAGPDALDRLRRNPYVPACLMEWKSADHLGQRLLRDDKAGNLKDHPTRLAGALNSVWRELLGAGDTAASEEVVIQLLRARGVDPGAALGLAEKSGLLRRAGNLLRVPGAAWLEDQVSAALLALEVCPPAVSVPTGGDLDALVHAAEVDAGLRLTDEQHSAVARLLALPVAALQGGAGVGKTTVMKVLATAWEKLRGNVVMGALAGKAALALSRGASSPNRPRLAYTIARLIAMLERQRDHAASPERLFPTSDVQFDRRTLLVIDEAGMMDTVSLHRLLSLLPAGARILFAGDEGQLPPVGIGRIFHDIVAEASRVAHLTKVLRQACDSLIPNVAALVREGRAPKLQVWGGESKGVFQLPASAFEAAQRRLREEGELLVVAAKRVTVAAINETESSLRRPSGTATRRLGPAATVAVGDPVVMTSNRYQDGLFNGLLGVVTQIAGELVNVLWDGEPEPRCLPAEAEGELELAYAITCHKAQGSAAKVVIVAVEDTRLVTREWLYTALTRGRELVLLAGESSAVAGAVARRTRRSTGFQLLQPNRET